MSCARWVRHMCLWRTDPTETTACASRWLRPGCGRTGSAGLVARRRSTNPDAAATPNGRSPRGATTGTSPLQKRAKVSAGEQVLRHARQYRQPLEVQKQVARMGRVASQCRLSPHEPGFGQRWLRRVVEVIFFLEPSLVDTLQEKGALRNESTYLSNIQNTKVTNLQGRFLRAVAVLSAVSGRCVGARTMLATQGHGRARRRKLTRAPTQHGIT